MRARLKSRLPLVDRDGMAARADHPHVLVSSAGVQGLERWPMDENAATELRRLGGDPDAFASRVLAPMDVAEADLVLTATTEHRGAVLSTHPDALGRTFTLREFAALAPYRPMPGEESEHGRALVAGMVVEAARRRGSVADADLDVPDPYRRSAEVHRAVADVIDEAVKRIVDGLVDGYRRAGSSPG
jgi:protein-tyrosine phosphatase